MQEFWCSGSWNGQGLFFPMHISASPSLIDLCPLGDTHNTLRFQVRARREMKTRRHWSSIAPTCTNGQLTTKSIIRSRLLHVQAILQPTHPQRRIGLQTHSTRRKRRASITYLGRFNLPPTGCWSLVFLVRPSVHNLRVLHVRKSQVKLDVSGKGFIEPWVLALYFHHRYHTGVRSAYPC